MVSIEDVIRDVDQMWFHANDRVINHDDPIANEFKSAVRGLLNEAKAHKDSDHIYESLRHLETIVEKMRQKEHEGVYHFNDIDDFHDRCEDLKPKIRALGT